MDFLVDALKHDSSQGHNFRILFEETVSLESAVETMKSLYEKHLGHPVHSYFCEFEGRYGAVKPDEFGGAVLNIRPTKVGLMGVTDDLESDIYMVRENNLDFSDVEKFYNFLETNS